MDEFNVAANTEEVATPQEDVEAVTEVTAEPTEQTEETSIEQTTEEQAEQKEDVTQTQAFAKRLKEETTKAAQKAKDEAIASMGMEWNGKPVTTFADYEKAMAEYNQQKYIDDLKQKNIPEELASEIAETKRFREQYEKEQQAKQQEEKQKSDYMSFLNYFKDSNNREFDTSKDKIPAEVWQDVDNGSTLLDAYTRHENKMLREKLANYEKGTQTKQVNQKNAQTSTGSITGQGETGITYYSPEDVENMDQQTVSKNWSSIMESMKKWK